MSQPEGEITPGSGHASDPGPDPGPEAAGWRARLSTFWHGSGTGLRRLVLCSLVTGLVSGLAAVVFLRSLELASEVILHRGMGLQPPPAGEGPARPTRLPTRWWLVLLIPAAGGLVAGAIVRRGAPEAAGDGTDALVRGFHRGGGLIRLRVPLIKGLASVVTIATGGSAAQEGPTAQIGAGLGSWLARVFGLTVSERRLLMLAGAAGGLGAIFRAPLGGALYATEVLYSSTASEATALLPCLASSIVAYSTFALFITPEPVFRVPPMAFHGWAELPLFALLGLACVPVGWLFTKTFHATRDPLFEHMPVPAWLKPGLGGLLVGAIGLVLPQVLSSGYGWVQWGAIGEPPDLVGPGETAYVPNSTAALLLTLALAKIAATSLTIGSGGSGGVFGPSMFIGGMLGGAVGQALAGLFPGAHIVPAAYVLVGMGGFFAGVSKAPLTSILMICELSNSYSLLVPLMLVCGLHLGLSTRWSLYEEQVPTPADSPAHEGDFVIDVLEQTHVSDVAVRTESIDAIADGLPIDGVLERASQSDQEVYPVMGRAAAGGEGQAAGDGALVLTGVIRLADLRHAYARGHLGPLVVAADLAIRPAPVVAPTDELMTALVRMNEHELNELPVVDPADPGRVVGLLSRQALTAAYIQRIRQLRGPKTTDGR